MKTIHVPFLKNISVETSIESASQVIDTINESHAMDCLNWPDEFPEKPTVMFKFARIEDGLLIKFFVEEEITVAAYPEDNQPVYKDSCVELFIAPSGDKPYYNFEFNAIGTLLLGFGADRHNREKAPAEITQNIKRFSSLGSHPYNNIWNNVPWQLTVMIPFSSFWHHSGSSFKNNDAKGNFQKCGDDLPVAHYLTWNPILTPKPDYHQPDFFGLFDFSE